MIVGVLILAMVPVSAVTSESYAQLSFSSADLSGNLSSGSAIRFLTVLQSDEHFSWRVNASRIVANVTTQRFIENGKPTNLSEPQARVAQGTEQYSEHVFDDASANSSSRSRQSSITTPVDFPLVARLFATLGNLSLVPTPPEPGTSAEPMPPETAKGLTWASKRDGSISISGNFSIDVQHSTTYIRNATNSSQYESGEELSGIGPQPPGQPHPFREVVERKVRLDLTNATLEFRSQGRTVSIASDRFEFTGNSTVLVRNADGMVVSGANRSMLQQVQWSMTAIERVQTWKAKPDDSVLQGRFDVKQAAPNLNPGPALNPEGPTIAKPRAVSWPVALAMVPAFVATFAVALFAYRRARPPTIDDVEWALLEKRPALAERLSQRLVKRNPTDSNAVFLYGTALAIQKRNRKLVQRLEPLAANLKPPRRVAIAYLLASSSHAIGDVARRDRWASEASKEAAFKRQLAREGAISRGPGSFTQTGYA